MEIWHIDGHEKLRRWGFYVYAGIDGFSRFITFAQLAVSKRSQGILEGFLAGVGTYGYPCRVRTDRSWEWDQLAINMIQFWGDTSVFLAGPSTSNQRIESFWNFLFPHVISFYKELFENLELIEVLDVNDPVHMFSLQVVFFPAISRQIELTVQAWNLHSIRSDKKRGVGGGIPANLFSNNPWHREVTPVSNPESYGVAFSAQSEERSLEVATTYHDPLLLEEATIRSTLIEQHFNDEKEVGAYLAHSSITRALIDLRSSVDVSAFLATSCDTTRFYRNLLIEFLFS